MNFGIFVYFYMSQTKVSISHFYTIYSQYSPKFIYKYNFKCKYVLSWPLTFDTYLEVIMFLYFNKHFNVLFIWIHLVNHQSLEILENIILSHTSSQSEYSEMYFYNVGSLKCYGLKNKTYTQPTTHTHANINNRSRIWVSEYNLGPQKWGVQGEPGPQPPWICYWIHTKWRM